MTVLEFMDELKADQVLQEKAKSLPNVEVFLHSQSLEVVGDGDKVTGLRVKDRKTDAERVIDLDGIFVQIGLAANSGVFRDVVETNKPGEIGNARKLPHSASSLLFPATLDRLLARP